MIRNVVFDVGNVFVGWAPTEIIARCFDLPKGGAENSKRALELFKSPIWLAINRGELTRAEAERAYCSEHGLSAVESEALFFHAMDHQTPVAGTQGLALQLQQAGFRLFGLTDNVHEIISHLKRRYDFWAMFDGAVVSAEVGFLKPDARIFMRLLDDFELAAPETVFLDDVLANVEGARSIGMEGLVFTTAEACERDLRTLGLSF